MANVFSNTKTFRDAYSIYKNQYGKDAVEYSVYANVLKSFNQRVMEKILFEAFEFELPYRLGSIRIKKSKTHFTKKTMKVDWQKTKELGQKVYHMNDHTNNFNFRFFWKKKTATFINKSFYSFTASRKNKRQLAAILKDDFRTVDYYE